MTKELSSTHGVSCKSYGYIAVDSRMGEISASGSGIHVTPLPFVSNGEPSNFSLQAPCCIPPPAFALADR